MKPIPNDEYAIIMIASAEQQLCVTVQLLLQFDIIFLKGHCLNSSFQLYIRPVDVCTSVRFYLLDGGLAEITKFTRAATQIRNKYYPFESVYSHLYRSSCLI